MAKSRKYYLNAVKTWTDRDVKKREIAEVNGVELKEFWSIEDLEDFISNF